MPEDCTGPAFADAVAVANAETLVQVEKATKAGKKPNIVIIWGDDVGQSNISAYSMGLMGYRTPNIDRVAREKQVHMVFSAADSGLVWADPGLDLTAEVIRAFDGSPSPAARPAAAPAAR